MKKPTHTESRFDCLVESLKNDQQHFVDDRTWANDWTESWVSFSDVLGFAARCRRSRAGVVNAIVRFHRCVSAANNLFRSQGGRVFRFTDAVFTVSESAEAALQFCANLQHLCLAQNAILLRNRTHTLAHHLLVVRTTLARGDTLTLDESGSPEIRTIGVQASSLLAGNAVVKAYEVEKQTVGAMISIPEGERLQLLAEKPTVRGSHGFPKSVLSDWFEKDGRFLHDGVIDFPWILLRPTQDRPEFWTDKKADVMNKLRLMVRIANLQAGEFLMANPGLSVAKHHAGLIRHLIELAQRLEGRPHLRRWTEADLRKHAQM